MADSAIPTKFLRPGDFPGNSTGVGCHFFQGKQKVILPKGKEKVSSYMLPTPTTLRAALPLWGRTESDTTEVTAAAVDCL